MKLTWFGHSAFRLDVAGAVVLIDPFFTGNPGFRGDVAAAGRGATHIVVTHGHGDHVGDTVRLAAETGAKLVTNYDLAMWLAKQGVQSFDPMNTGGTTDQGAFTVSLVRADHSAAMVEADVGFPLGSANGVVLNFKGAAPTLYHAGDTDIFSDMALIAEIYQPKIACLPIGDRFTMNPRTAALAAKRFLTTVETVIPCHYGSFPIIETDASAFVAAMSDGKARVLVPHAGEPVEV
jgi:L-ascorbate metabolism protein UlaG (beta-lactamase superfamily)